MAAALDEEGTMGALEADDDADAGGATGLEAETDEEAMGLDAGTDGEATGLDAGAEGVV